MDSQEINRLVVDDSQATRALLEEQLVYWGVRCVTVESASEALICIEQALMEVAHTVACR